MRPERLLLLTPDYPPPPGGIQLVSERLANGMERFDTRVLAPSGRGAGAEPELDGRATVRRIGAARLPRRRGSPRSTPRPSPTRFASGRVSC